MPTYEYACKSCSERLEVQQKFTDDALTECPACGGSLRKVFGNVGIAFKGSGFYKTDSRGSSKSSSDSTSSSDTGSGSAAASTSSGSSESSGSSDSKPASAPAATKTESSPSSSSAAAS